MAGNTYPEISHKVPRVSQRVHGRFPGSQGDARSVPDNKIPNIWQKNRKNLEGKMDTMGKPDRGWGPPHRARHFHHGHQRGYRIFQRGVRTFQGFLESSKFPDFPTKNIQEKMTKNTV